MFFLYKSLFMHEIFQYIYIYISKEDILKLLDSRHVWLHCPHRKIETHNKRNIYFYSIYIRCLVLKSRHLKKTQHCCVFH